MLNTYDNLTLNSIFRPKAFIKKKMHFNINFIVSVPPFCTLWWNKMVEQRLCSCYNFVIMYATLLWIS